MEQEISNLFPNGVRALVVDDDAGFLASSSMMLSTLNFKVDTCRSLASALRLLNQEKIKDDFDAILVNAEKVAACSFDFHGIAESIMCIPVLYFLPLDHKVAGGEATLLRPGTNTIKEPLDANDVCNLWRGIAWRKCSLKAKADQAGGRRVLPDAVVEALLAGGRGRKRKKSSSNPGCSSGTSSLAGNQAAMRQQQMNLTEGQQERDNLLQLAQQRRGMGAGKKNKGNKAPMFQQPRAMDGRQPGQQPQQQSLLVQSVLRTLDVPPYNPRIYADTAGLSYNAGAGDGNTDVLPPALTTTPPVSRSPVPAPAPHPVYPAARSVFGATAPSAAVATMAAGGRPPLTPRPFSAPYLDPPPRIVQQDMFALGMPSGTGMRRRETGAITLNFQQPPAGGNHFTGMASGSVKTFGASAAATAHAGAYGNAGCSRATPVLSGLSAMVTMNTGTNSNPPLAPHHVGVASNEPAMDPGLYDNNYCYRSLMAPRLIDHRVAPANQAAAAMGTLGSDGYIDYSSASAMAPLQADHGHGVAAGMEEEALNANNFSSYSSASLLSPDHQVLGMVSNVNELTISGGASVGDDAAAASFTASQNLVAAAPNGDQFAPGALDLDDGDISGLAMGSHQGPDMAMDGNAGFAAMSPADPFPAHTIFSMEELLGPDDQQGGATDGAAADDDAAGTSLIGEEGNGTLDIGAAGNLDGDFILGDLWDF